MGAHSELSKGYANKIIVLWVVFLLGTLFHTQLALMPLFHGLSVAESHADALGLDLLFWLMLAFFLVPLLAILVVLFHPTQRYRSAHFGLTLVYTALNCAHLLADVAVKAPSYQIFLMTFLLFVGLILNVVSQRWSHSTVRLRYREGSS